MASQFQTPPNELQQEKDSTECGKTTFVNAVIDAMTRLNASDRLVTTELQSSSPNTVSLQTSHMAGVDMRSLAKITMRLAPKRIIVGEVLDFAALEMLKVWDTGHPGGVSTFHADSAVESLHRLEISGGRGRPWPQA